MNNIFDSNNPKLLYNHLKSIIAENQDNRTKCVGDIVKVWDGSGNLDKNTGEKRAGIDKLFENEAIVIEDNCKVVYSDEMMNKFLGKNYDQTLDLLLKFPSGEEVYCFSKYVKRTDKYSI